jgi:predicted nicotinamide N-methyase
MQGEIFKVLDQSLPPQEWTTTTDRPKTRANTGSSLAHAREATREKQRTERPGRAKNAWKGGVTLARQIREGPPALARRAVVKKPETGSGF